MAEFIAAVRQRPCLWDVSHKDYRNQDQKDLAWREIVHMKFPDVRNVGEAKSEWKKLRDNHRDSLKRSKSNINIWRYATLMEFLLPFMKRRIKRRRVSSNDPQSPQNDDEQTVEYYNEDYIEINGPTSTNEISNHTIDDYGIDEDHLETRKRKPDGELDEFLREIKDRQRMRQEERETMQELRSFHKAKHPTDLFLESMAKTIKEMPPWMQIRVKRKIFAAVSEAEDQLQYSEPAGAHAPDHKDEPINII